MSRKCYPIEREKSHLSVSEWFWIESWVVFDNKLATVSVLTFRILEQLCLFQVLKSMSAISDTFHFCGILSFQCSDVLSCQSWYDHWFHCSAGFLFYWFAQTTNWILFRFECMNGQICHRSGVSSRRSSKYKYTMTFFLHQGGVVMSSQITHTVIKIHPLAHILDTWASIFSSCALFTVYPNRIM